MVLAPSSPDSSSSSASLRACRPTSSLPAKFLDSPTLRWSAEVVANSRWQFYYYYYTNKSCVELWGIHCDILSTYWWLLSKINRSLELLNPRNRERCARWTQSRWQHACITDSTVCSGCCLPFPKLMSLRRPGPHPAVSSGRLFRFYSIQTAHMTALVVPQRPLHAGQSGFASLALPLARSCDTATDRRFHPLERAR